MNRVGMCASDITNIKYLVNKFIIYIKAKLSDVWILQHNEERGLWLKGRSLWLMKGSLGGRGIKLGFSQYKKSLILPSIPSYLHFETRPVAPVLSLSIFLYSIINFIEPSFPSPSKWINCNVYWVTNFCSIFNLLLYGLTCAHEMRASSLVGIIVYLYCWWLLACMLSMHVKNCCALFLKFRK